MKIIFIMATIAMAFCALVEQSYGGRDGVLENAPLALQTYYVLIPILSMGAYFTVGLYFLMKAE